MKHINQRQLMELTVPTVSAKRQKQHLKRALLAAASQDTNVKQSRWSTLMTKKKLLLTGATATVAVVAVLAVGLFGSQSPAAYAEQLTNESLQNFSKLPQDRQEDMDMRMNGNAAAELQAAEHAKDLRVLTYDQLKNYLPQSGAGEMSVHGPNGSAPGPDMLDPTTLKYLSYTDSEGATHIIGVDSHGLPAMIMIYRDSGNMHSGSVQVMGGHGGQGTMIMGSDDGSGPAGQPSGSTCGKAADGSVHCTTSGSSGGDPSCQTLPGGEVTCRQSAAQ